jgi:hypothetical protein
VDFAFAAPGRRTWYMVFHSVWRSSIESSCSAMVAAGGRSYAEEAGNSGIASRRWAFNDANTKSRLMMKSRIDHAEYRKPPEHSSKRSLTPSTYKYMFDKMIKSKIAKV